MQNDFCKLRDRGVLLEKRKSNRSVSYPYFLICAMDQEEAVSNIGHHADDVEHPYYGDGVLDQSEAFQTYDEIEAEKAANRRSEEIRQREEAKLKKRTAERKKDEEERAQRQAELWAKKKVEQEKRRQAEAEEKVKLLIQSHRRTYNLCILCGKPMGALDRLQGDHHAGCSSFSVALAEQCQDSATAAAAGLLTPRELLDRLCSGKPPEDQILGRLVNDISYMEMFRLTLFTAAQAEQDLTTQGIRQLPSVHRSAFLAFFRREIAIRHREFHRAFRWLGAAAFTTAGLGLTFFYAAELGLHSDIWIIPFIIAFILVLFFFSMAFVSFRLALGGYGVGSARWLNRMVAAIEG